MTDKAKKLLNDLERQARDPKLWIPLLETRKQLEDYIEELEHFMRAENWLAEQMDTPRG